MIALFILSWWFIARNIPHGKQGVLEEIETLVFCGAEWRDAIRFLQNQKVIKQTIQ